MADTAAEVSTEPTPGLLTRVIGVLLSPRETYAAVAARPKALGVLLLTIAIFAIGQGWFVSTEVGKDIVMDQQVRAMESFGVTISDEMYAQMESRMSYAPYTTAGSMLVFLPLSNALVAGLLLLVFSMMMGGTGTFKQLFAIVSHSNVIVALQQLIVIPLSLAAGRMASANLAIFVPMLEEDAFLTVFLGTIDLFLVWWVISLAIGTGVLYKRKTGPIATVFLSLYVVIALILAFVRS